VSRPKILELASGDFIDRAEDVILAGPIGTGKNMLAIRSRSASLPSGSRLFAKRCLFAALYK
jgi:DNA replication protein DnaC